MVEESRPRGGKFMTNWKPSPDAKRRLLVSTAMLGALYTGYGRRAYAAGSCVEAPTGTYACTGAFTTSQIFDNSSGPLVVTGTSGFGVSSTTGNAVTLGSGGTTGGITFTDTDPSNIAISGASNPPDTVNGIGIDAEQSAGSGNLTISTGSSVAISGGSEGVFVENIGGTGAVSITTLGTVTSTNGTGISASNSTGLGGLTINTATVTAASTGINADNFKGALSITATGLVSATGVGETGLIAYNASTGSSLTVSTAAVTGAGDGMQVTNRAGPMMVTATGTITGTSSNGVIITNGGTSATISLADVVGGTGSGLRGVTGTDTASGDMSITTGAVSGGSYGFHLTNSGTGAMSITATGPVTAAAALSTGIYAVNTGAATDLTINTAAVTGTSRGIYASNLGTGNLSITSTGTVTGTAGQGIYAKNSVSSKGMTIQTASVSGGTWGIYGKNFGSGALSITSTGTVSGAGSEGINAYNRSGVNGSGQALIISAASVTGELDGIEARNSGAGSLTITTAGSGTVSSPVGSGIYATNFSNGTSLTVSTGGAVNGTGGYGIHAKNYGTGPLSITATGPVTSPNSGGIYGYSKGSDPTTHQALTISATDVTGHLNGILALNRGNGTLMVTANGTVTGTTGNGIFTKNYSTNYGASITVSSGATVKGFSQGVYAFSGSQPIGLTNNGTIQNLSGSTSGLAIRANGGVTTITNNNTITGELQIVAAGPNSFTNGGTGAGTWNTTGESTFGGSDTVTNSANGTIVAANSGASTPALTTFVGLATFNNAGQLTMHNGFAGDEVGIHGNFVGQSGGSVAIDTFLGGSSSPTDFLFISGNASGANKLFVFNTTGPGALTTGLGIEVIEVVGSSTAAFTLGAPVEAGAFAYDLSSQPAPTARHYE
jgi:autotransporter family porin